MVNRFCRVELTLKFKQKLHSSVIDRRKAQLKLGQNQI